MATARLTHESKTTPGQKIAILTGLKRKIQKTLESDNMQSELAAILEDTSPAHRQMCRIGFRKAYTALNIINSINDLDEEERISYRDSIKKSVMEAGELVSECLNEIDHSISRITHRQQVESGTVSVPIEEEESEEKIIEKVRSFEDIKEAYKKIKQNQEREEAKEAAAAAKANKAKPERKPEDLSEQTLEILKKYAPVREKLPTNVMGQVMRGIINCPVMVMGRFRTSSLKRAPINIHNIGSGFFLFEYLPLFYCESGLKSEARIAVMRKHMAIHAKGHIAVCPDIFIKDDNSDNLEYTVLMPKAVYSALSPFKFVDKIAFPWEQRTPKKGPAHTRAELEGYIKQDKRIIALEEKSRSLIRSYREAQDQKPKAEAFVLAKKLALKELEGKIAENRDGKSRRAQKDEAEDLSRQIEKLETSIKKYSKVLSSHNKSMGRLRKRSQELRVEIREEYIKAVKAAEKAKKAKNKIKRRK